jgi:predicted glycosyltransferase involved in capsule biosynthesis
MEKIDLNETTFIIPIRIEHPDRYRNSKTTLSFLNQHFITNVFIYESSKDGESELDFLESLGNLKIKHWVIKDEETFHRTKYLNIMLDSVTTKVSVNYDIDVILSPKNYIECQNKILNGECDVIYPYEFGMGQKMVNPNINLDEFRESGFDINYIDNRNEFYSIFTAECGHCVFFNTDIYKSNGGENERFLSYGPEDKERKERFEKLGFKVEWKSGYYVYHFEHYRGSDSSQNNPHFSHNWQVYNSITQLCINYPDRYREFYQNPDYSIKYNTIGKDKKITNE